MIFKTTPMKHQEAGVIKGIDILKRAGHLALFGEVGTGKTKIAIDIFLNQRAFINHMVVLCPKGLFNTWQKEILKHSDLKDHQIIRWDTIKSGKGLKVSTENMLARSGYIFIINIESLQYDNAIIEKLFDDLSKKPSIIAIDESVKIQTPSAARTKKALKVSKLFAQRIIMTGTDISSGPQALYSQFLFLDPMFWKSRAILNFTSYKGAYTLSKKVRIQGGREIDVVKRMDEMSIMEQAVQRVKLEKLHDAINPVTIRILRKDCLDLPEQQNIEIQISLSKDERCAYDSMRKTCIAEIDDEMFEAINAISVFSKLRQITSGHIAENSIQLVPSKLQFLLDDIEDHSETAIIVAYFQYDVRIITEAISKKFGSESVKSYFGGNNDKLNEQAKNSFEEGKLRFLVASHEMIAQGHNLQEYCHLMYIYSISLNSEVNAQFKGRIDRNGQKYNPVFKYLLAEKTIDEDLHELIQQKMNLQAAFSSMGKDKLKGLLNR